MENTLYSIISKETIIDILTSLQYCTKLTVRLLDNKANELLYLGDKYKFCSTFSSLISPNNSCRNIQRQASDMSISFGNTYIFSCPSGLNSMVYPIITKNELFGSVIVGPFLMDEPDSFLISSISKKYPCATDLLLSLYESSSDIPVISPTLVTHISKILFYLLSQNIKNDNDTFSINREKIHQQSRINEAIQLYKSGSINVSSSYPIHLEQELMCKVKAGDTSATKKLLNDLLGYVFFSKGNSLELVKYRSIELCSLLSRAVIQSGAHSENILSVNDKFLDDIQSINSIDSLCYRLQETVDTFIESMYYKPINKYNSNIKKATEFISNNYTNHITLEDVANHVNLSPAYLSSLFKETLGVTYKDYLNTIRINESKRLLLNSTYSIIDIAISTGFENQSYFSKVFRKMTGMSPSQYRK